MNEGPLKGGIDGGVRSEGGEGRGRPKSRVFYDISLRLPIQSLSQIITWLGGTNGVSVPLWLLVLNANKY